MKHSTLRVLQQDEFIEATDIESLDFMVVIKGSLTVEYENGREIQLDPLDYIYPQRTLEYQGISGVKAKGQ
jgi:hypothetical protein